MKWEIDAKSLLWVLPHAGTGILGAIRFEPGLVVCASHSSLAVARESNGPANLTLSWASESVLKDLKSKVKRAATRDEVVTLVEGPGDGKIIFKDSTTVPLYEATSPYPSWRRVIPSFTTPKPDAYLNLKQLKTFADGIIPPKTFKKDGTVPFLLTSDDLGNAVAITTPSYPNLFGMLMGYRRPKDGADSVVPAWITPD